MKFTPEQKQRIYELYMKEVVAICEECDWVTRCQTTSTSQCDILISKAVNRGYTHALFSSNSVESRWP